MNIIQVQKLETLGMIAGGIAHDFNNMLTVILGYAELAEERPGAPSEELGEICKAVHAAAHLAQQLLEFGKRTGLEPAALDLGAMLADIEPMLRLSVGAKIITQITAVPGLWKVWAPVAQMEQIVVNLALNARDAMPDGGNLTIEAHNDTRGGRDWVCLTVSDTGTGMDEETAKKIFEPFFTTKPQGTGLGLAMAQATVKQSGGLIEVRTSKTTGTAMDVIMPRFVNGIEAGKKADASLRSQNTKGQGTVLLVEDQEHVRRLVAYMLGKLGYDVIEARCGTDALAAAAQVKIDLMLSDVVMPGMNLTELIELIHETHPDAKIALMSGSNDSPVENLPMIRKPFRLHELAEFVATALGAGQRD